MARNNTSWNRASNCRVEQYRTDYFMNVRSDGWETRKVSILVFNIANAIHGLIKEWCKSFAPKVSKLSLGLAFVSDGFTKRYACEHRSKMALFAFLKSAVSSLNWSALYRTLLLDSPIRLG